jgi:proteasome accessory factor C
MSHRLGTRLGRILLLIPYAIRNPGVTISELSARFGVDREDLIEDLQLIYVCGLPGYGPGDLIDVTFAGENVYVDMADYFGAPLRLTPAEALALLAGGETVARLPGMEEADALRRGLAKLSRALGGSERESEPPGVQVELAPGPAQHMDVLQRALSSRRRVHLEYFSASRGILSERDVDPWGLIATLGRWYLIAWDHASDDERMFRIDRVKRAELLETRAEPPPDFDPRRYRNAFRPRDRQEVVSFEISDATSRWFEDSYPCRSARRLDDGWSAVELVSGGVAWAATLVLRLGSEVRAVQPQSVVDAAGALAKVLAARHA